MSKILVLFLLVSLLSILPIAPILLIAYAIIAVLHADRHEAAYVVILSGLLLDFFSGLPDGILTLSLIVAALTVYFLSKAVLATYSHRLILFISVLGASLIFNLSVILVSLLLSIFDLVQPGEVLRNVWSVLWLNLFLTAILAYPMLWLYESLQRSKLLK